MSFAGPHLELELEDHHSTSIIPIPSELQGLRSNDSPKIKTFVVQQKKNLLTEGKLVLPGHEIVNNQLILRWKPSPPVNSAENPIILSSDDEGGPASPPADSPGPVSVNRIIQISLDNHHPRDYIRRVAVSGDAIYAISMYYNIQSFDLKRSTARTVKHVNKDVNVQDVCLIGDSLVVGTRENLSVIDVVNPEEILAEYRMNTPLTCLTRLNDKSLEFISGTDNGLVHFQIPPDGKLKLKHQRLHDCASKITAVAVKQQDTVISASTRKIRVFDLSEGKIITSGATSNDVFQLKISPDHPNLLAMEVSHLDRQIHLFDIRMPLFTKPPILEMGYRISDLRSKNSRFIKGDIREYFYVRGYEDGSLNLFDIRRPNSIVTNKLIQRKAPIVHCILPTANSIYAVGKNTLSYVDINLNSK